MTRLVKSLCFAFIVLCCLPSYAAGISTHVQFKGRDLIFQLELLKRNHQFVPGTVDKWDRLIAYRHKRINENAITSATAADMQDALWPWWNHALEKPIPKVVSLDGSSLAITWLIFFLLIEVLKNLRFSIYSIIQWLFAKISGL